MKIVRIALEKDFDECNCEAEMRIKFMKLPEGLEISLICFNDKFEALLEKKDPGAYLMEIGDMLEN